MPMSELAVVGRVLRSLVPRTAKDAIKVALTEYRFRRALRKIVELPAEQMPTPALLAELRFGWANDGYAAGVDYLVEITRRAVVTAGPILECGSGLTTILLGVLAARRGVDVWSLEHIPDWYARVRSVLEPFSIASMHLNLTNLRSYGSFDWYDPPLASMPMEFRLVICDGPPGTTRGGRYGLFPVMRERLAKGSLVLLDDANRPEEENAIERWGVSTSLKWGASGAFAVITV